MPTIQQVIDGLECFKTNQHRCKDCQWNPHPGMPWPYGCIKGQRDIIDAAQEALREEERRGKRERDSVSRETY